MSDSTAPVTAAVPPPGYEINLVNPPYVGYQLVAVVCVFAALSTLVVGLRLFTRKFLVKTMGWDDTWVTIAWFFGVVFSISDCMQTKYGAGTHLWDITLPRFSTFLKWQMLLGTSYISTLTFSKISILVFYLRLSPERNFRIMVYATIGFTLAYNFAGVLVVIFSCNPIAASWDLALAALPTTKCVNRPADYLAAASLNIFTDLLIFCLPLKTIWSIQLPLNQRLSVIAIFATGLFVTIVSVIRIKSVVHIIGSPDLTWDTSDLLVWSTIEAHVTIMCACFPTLKPFFRRFFPAFLEGSSEGPSQYPSVPGRSHKLDSRDTRNMSYAMKTFKVNSASRDEGYETTVETGKRGRMAYGDNDSEEFIIGIGDKNSVVVTKTIDLS